MSQHGKHGSRYVGLVAFPLLDLRTGLQDLPNGQKIGIDPALLPFSEYQTLSKSLSEANKSTLVPVEDNLVDAIWARQQPPRPSNEVFRLEDQYSGASLGSKLMKLREKLAETGSPGMVVSQLDDVAWMFNLRGSDIPYNPVRTTLLGI